MKIDKVSIPAAQKPLSDYLQVYYAITKFREAADDRTTRCFRLPFI
ncbi:MAG TPA: hypothetical protein VE593_00780 [Nitrososphaeraceae archaeon]|nr:hypothetical protein [Nitrososphaeraceae archaeon]